MFVRIFFALVYEPLAPQYARCPDIFNSGLHRQPGLLSSDRVVAILCTCSARRTVATANAIAVVLHSDHDMTRSAVFMH
ncbi:hypothetical protein FHX35_000668 [Auritidibacter ignavus]|nr:hypothetical protein [Auritidibacter ignavus]